MNIKLHIPKIPVVIDQYYRTYLQIGEEQNEKNICFITNISYNFTDRM